VLVLVRRLSLGQVHAVHLVLDELDVVLHHRFTDSASPIHFFRILHHRVGWDEVQGFSLFPVSCPHG
jgi:hypothetical protein